MKLLFATTNQGKLTESQGLLAELVDLKLVSLTDFPKLAKMEVAETAKTLAGNAQLKAKAYAAATQLPTLAEDSGLFVEALDGQPGVFSARFGENDQARNQKLLTLLEGKTQRQAEFRTVLCYYQPVIDQAEYFQGVVNGEIGLKPEGEDGFGYDPLFIPSGYDHSFAKLGNQIKNQISHRRRALEKFSQFWAAQKTVQK